MTSKTLLAPLLMAFGFVLGVPALGDGSDSGSTTDALIDVVVVDAPSDEMTLCVTLNTDDAAVPCVISADGSTLACVTLEPGDNYVLVPDVVIESVTVCSFPENPGVN